MKIALSALLLAALATGSWFGVQMFLGPPPPLPDVPEAAADAAPAADSAEVLVALAPLANEVEALTARLADAEATADSLRLLLDAQSAAADAARSDATELAATLTKMEDANLESVVQRLDGRSFVQLYRAASSRNQVRLMGSLTPEQAASFIRHQLPGGTTRTVSHAVADTVARS